jgi:serine phosphatase RsbU (regulator of sigma subunit)
MKHFGKHRKIKNVPQEYLVDFMSESVKLMKVRVQVAIGIFLVTFIGGSGLGQLIMYKGIEEQLSLTWGFLVCACIAALLLVRKAKSLTIARACAYLLVIAILSILATTHIKIDNPPIFSLITFIIMLFASTVLIPWRTMDITVLTLLHMGAFTWTFLNVPTYLFKGQMCVSEPAGYFQGIVLLSVVFIICAAATKRENERKIENFVLFKEIEKQNRKMQKELELATRVHKRLIPKSAQTALADIAVTYLPMSYMGGDYAKFQIIKNNKLLFMICDVTGHGVSAALLVNALNAEFEQLVKASHEPGILLRELDKFIKSDFAEINMFLTAFCGLLDYDSMKFKYSSYGHPPQYMYLTAKKNLKTIIPQTGMLGLPVEDDEVYQSAIPFNRKDQIFLFTDGVVEARNLQGEEYGAGRVESFIEQHQSLDPKTFNESLMKELNAHTRNRSSDDVFVLNICTK